MIEEFKDELKSLRNIFNEIKKTRIIKRTRNKRKKNETKRKLNMLDDEVNDILEKLDVDITALIAKCNFAKKPYDFECVEEERKLRIIAKKE